MSGKNFTFYILSIYFFNFICHFFQLSKKKTEIVFLSASFTFEKVLAIF